MVAVFTGNGLGLFDTSVTQLGRSHGGSSRLGQSRDGQYINAANGNLVLQGLDETLLVRGLDASYLRTYNSRGSVLGAGQDGWVSGFERKVVLNGALNSPASSAVLAAGDGQTQVFAYVAPNVYRATAGDGAHDLLTWNATAGTWTLREGSSGREETYADPAGAQQGRLLTIRDTRSDGTIPAQFDVLYDAQGRVVEVRSVDGAATNVRDAIVFAYNANGQLESVSTRENGSLRSQVAYGYDAVGRLAWVQTDLTPTDATDNAWNVGTPAANDGRRFRTSYTYTTAAAADLRIARVDASDGTVVGYTYEDDGAGGHRVRTVTRGSAIDGSLRTTTFTYLGNSTEVRDGSGQTWTYEFDAKQQLVAVLEPAIGGLRQKTSYVYDADGNLVRTTQTPHAGLSAQLDTVFQYDGNGNRVLQRDRLGNTLTWTWSANNELLAETRYTVADADGLDPTHVGSTQLPSGALTTRYAYDNRGRVRFAVSAAGEVREFVYATAGNGIGQIASERRFLGETYAGPGYAEADLESWASASGSARRTSSSLVAHAYDAKGRLQQSVAYATVAAGGAGVLDAATAVTTFVYDAQGLLRQQVQWHGSFASLAGAPPAGSQVTDYVYDGMGRLLGTLARDIATAAMPDAVADPVGHAAWLAANDATTLLTSSVHVDSANQIRVTQDAGAIRVETRNRAGELVSASESGVVAGVPVERTTRNYYDAAGRLRASQDASGARTYLFYDTAGRIIATVDGAGAVTEIVYDGIGRVMQTIGYANSVNTMAWLSGDTVTKNRLVFAATVPTLALDEAWVQTSAGADRLSHRSYDAAGRLSMQTDAAGLITVHGYDGAGRLVVSTVAKPGDATAPSRVTRMFYDGADQLLATLDAAGFLTESSYDAGGRLVRTVRYATATAPALRATGTLAQLRPASAASDQVTRHFYNGRGLQVGLLDAEGYLTEFTYDETGNQRAQQAFGKQLSGLTGSEGLAALRSLASTNVPAGVIAARTTQRSFNALGQVSVEVDHQGTITRHRYDEAGRHVASETGNGPAEIRKGTLRYDVFGNVTGELRGEGSARLLDGMTEAQVDAIFVQYGIRHSYDLAGRRIESIDAAGNKTWYFYDARGLTTMVVRGVAANGVANAQGEVAETRYSAFGEVIDSIAYTGRITITTPGSRASVQTALGALMFNASLDSRTQLRYDQRGLLAERIDAENYRTTLGYTAFGELRQQTTYEANGSTVFATRTNTYDQRGLLVTVADAGGATSRAQTLVYDAFGRLASRIDARGSEVTFGYDRLGRQVSQTARAVSGRDETTTLAYDAFAQVVSQRDAANQTTTYRYDDTSRTVTVTSPEGVAVATQYNRFGQVVLVSQPLPDGSVATTTTTYDKDGLLVGRVDALGRPVTLAYDARGLLIRNTDASGRRIDFSYDAAGRTLTRTEDAGGLNLVTTYAYDGQGRQIAVTDASGRQVAMKYDRKGNLVETVRDPAGLALRTTYTWDRDGRQLSVTEGAGTPAAQTTAYGYDKLGRRVSETKAAGSLNLVTTYAYDSNDNVVSRTDASNRTVRYSYDAANRLRFSVDGAGNVSEVAYDAAGRTTMTRRYAKAAVLTGLPAAPTEAEMSALVSSQALANDALDEVGYHVFDRDGREVLAVDGSGGVTLTDFDSAGRRVLVRRHAQPVALGATLRAKLRAGTATMAEVGAVASALDQIERAVYDAAGQLVYRVDAAGGFVRHWYDAAGRLSARVRFATPIAVAGIVDATTVAQLDAQLTWTSADRGEYFVHDAAGRLRYTYNSAGQLTQDNYDGAGRGSLAKAYATALWVTPTVQGKLFAGTAVEADFAAFVAANDAAARAQYVVYDAAGRARYTVTRSGTGVGTVAEARFDAAGRTVATVQHGTTVAFNPAHTESTLNTALAGSARRTTSYLHDSAGRLRFTVDATGAVGEARYDGAGRVTDEIAYGVRPPAASTTTEAALVAWTQTQAAADVRRTQSAHDAAGRLASRTDALAKIERFTYDGVDRVLTHTDRNSQVWTFQYDAAGRRTAEISPLLKITAVDASGAISESQRSVVARFTYDALGNLLTRTDNADAPLVADRRRTSYAYDSRGNQIRTTFPDAGAVDHATGAIVATGVQPTTEITYDVLGQAVVQKDVRGHYSYRTYDVMGRLVYEVDQEKNVTSYSYNGFGEQSVLRRHAAVLQTAAVPAWAEGQALTLAKIQTAGAVVSGSADRTLTTSYTALGQKSAIAHSPIGYFRADGSAATGTPTTTFVYNGFGDLVQENVLREGTAGQGDAVWLRTFRYHDALGRNTLTVDAEGYVTETAFNATGEAVATTEYARVLSPPAVLNVVPGLPGPGDAASGYDRRTEWTYDALGRKASETAIRHYQRVDGSTGVRGVGKTFGYDNEGRVTLVTDETGTVTTTYDALGRSVAVQEAARAVVVAGLDAVLTGTTGNDLTSAGATQQRSPYTTMGYDAFGNMVAVRRYANGRNGQVAAVADDARDQLQLTRHDWQGRAVWERDGAGATLTRAFDAADNVSETRFALDGNDGRSAIVRVLTTYDDAGRTARNRTLRDQYLNGVLQGTAVDADEEVVYNAFGEIVQKTHAGVLGTLTYTYDAGGRLTASNEGGAVRNFGYDLAGFQVRQWQTAWLSATDGSVEATTITRVDGLGRAVEVVLPPHTAPAGATGTITQRFDRWGNVLAVIDARGFQTDYEYNELNQVVRETRPLVLVVGENGSEVWERPVNRWYYDALGRLVATRDANGNLRTNEYDATGRLVVAKDAYGNATRHAYDALGNLRATQDPLGYLKFTEYDRLGRVVGLGDYLPSLDGTTRAKNYLQRFTLTQNGDRRVVIDGLNASATYDFDSRQHLLRSRTSEGVVAEFAYDVMGRRIRESNALSGSSSLTDRDGDVVRFSEQTWDYDVYGRLTDHNNLSGRDSNFVHDAASARLTGESSAGGLGVTAATASKTYSYYANGRLREVVEAGGARFRYEYDASGNRTVEESQFTDAYNQTVRILTRTTYDSNNRIQRVVQDDLISGKRVFDLITDYDANGNRRRVRAASGYGPNVGGIAVTNSAPVVIKPVDDRVVRKGIAAQFRVLFTDVFRDLEQDALTLTITQQNGAALPSWLVASRDADTGEIVFSANPGVGLADQDIVVKLTASETANAGNAAVETFVVKVRTNSAPVLVQPGNTALRIKTQQPWAKDLVATELFADPDVGDVLRLSIENTLPSWLTVDASNPGVIRLSGTPTTASTFTLRLRATDEKGAYVVKQFDITTAANSAPVVVAAAGATDAIIGREFAWSRPLAGVFSDLDGDALQVTAKQANGSALPTWMSFQYLYDQATPELKFSGSVPASEVSGNVYSIVLTARDVDGATITTTLTVRVFTNRAPVATAGTLALPALRVMDNYSRTLPLSAFFADPEADPLTIVPVWPQGSTLPSWLKVTVDYAAGTVTFSGRPTNNTQAGNLAFQLRATDIAGLTSLKSVGLVIGTDTAPTRTTVALADRTLSIGRAFSYTLPAGLFVDADGDTLSLTAATAVQEYESEPGFQWWNVRLDPLPSWMTFDAATRTFSGTVPAGVSGWFTVRVQGVDSRGRISAADDQYVGEGGNPTDGDIVFSLQPWTNTAPVHAAGSLPGRTLVHGGAVDFPLPAGAFSEPDGDALTYTAQVLVGSTWMNLTQLGLTIDATTGRITGTAANLTQASFSARIVARDPQGLTATGTFTITVTNTPPTVAPIPAQSAGRNAAYSLSLAAFFNDVNGNALTYSASGLPAGLTLNATTGVISGVVSAALGSYTVNVSANDGRGGTIGTSFSLAVVNSAPLAPTIANQIATGGSAWSYTVPVFTDPNGDVLTYTASGLPSWVTFNAATRTLSGTAGVVGNWTITVRATDPSGLFASASFVLTTPSTPPVYNGGLANQTAQPGQAFGYTFAATVFTDPNGDALTYSADANGAPLPAWLTFNASLRQFSGVPTTAGSVTVRVTASDGTTPVSRTFVITVPNVAPVAGTPLPDRSATMDQSVSWTLPAGAFSDANGDAIGYVLLVERPAYQYFDDSNPWEPWDPLESTCRHASLSIL